MKYHLKCNGVMELDTLMTDIINFVETLAGYSSSSILGCRFKVAVGRKFE